MPLPCIDSSIPCSPNVTSAATQPRFLKPTKDLLNYIRDLADATKSHLADFVKDLDPNLALADPDDFCSRLSGSRRYVVLV